MTRYFSQYWKNKTHDINREHQESVGKPIPLEHTSDDNLVARGVRIGDVVFAVTVINGKLRMIGAMEVGWKARTAKEAHAALIYPPDRLWSAADHLMARRCTLMNFNGFIEAEAVRDLRFYKQGRLAPLIFEDDKKLDRQTLRGIREMSEESAHLLLDLHLPRMEPISRYARRKRAGR